MLGIPHPYFTASLPGVGGAIKLAPEDFIVSEVPLYAPCGEGEHTYFEIEKVDLSTLEALERLSKALGVAVKEFGYAGLKDRKGITRQTLSVAQVEPARIEALQVAQIRVLGATRHKNKLRVGHLRGNRFRLRVRGVVADAGTRVGEILDVLGRTGVPNYYGPQRFGNRGDAHRVGRSLLVGDDRAAIRRILGHPASTEQNPNVVRAREHFMGGEYQDALDAFPPTYREERRLLAYMVRAGENYAGARQRLGEVAKRLYFSAYQSYLFNVALSKRLSRTGGNLGGIFEGDVAFLHRNGASFQVLDGAEARARAETFEISPSGPIFGMKMLHADGLEGEIETEVLRREGIGIVDFHRLMPHLRLEGGRRPFRVRIEDLEWGLEGADLVIQFFLPRGSYATTVLREIMKVDEVPEAYYEDGEEEKHGLWRPPADRVAEPREDGDLSLPED